MQLASYLLRGCFFVRGCAKGPGKEKMVDILAVYALKIDNFAERERERENKFYDSIAIVK